MDSIPATSIEGTINPSFTDRNRLLFHYFMDGHTILFQHLIELIDTDNTTIGQDHGSSFNTALSCVLITHNGGRQTYYLGQKEGHSYLHLTSLYPSYLQQRALYSRQNARIGTDHKKDHQPNWVWFLWMSFIQEGHWYHHEGELHCLTHVPCLLRGVKVRLAWYSHDPWWMEQYYYKGCDRYWDSWLEDKQGHFMAIHNSRILPIQSGVNSTFELFIEITEMWLAKMTGLMEPAVTCEVWGLHKIL